MELNLKQLLSAEFDILEISNNPAPLHDFVLSYYEHHGRDLPWRNADDPYKIFLSEIMLQQTQVPRVIEHYKTFINALPDFKALSEANTKKLLNLWQGLGYNRRALYLREAAEKIVNEYNSILPASIADLQSLKGIGYNTAASICAFAFNMPVVFIETNIRRFYIYFFYREDPKVEDSDILLLAEKTVYKENPRDWYNALMDIGSVIPKVVKNPNRKSGSYKKQSRFEGSLRQIRGEILRILQSHEGDLDDIRRKSTLLQKRSPEYISKAANSLKNDGFIRESDGKFKLR